jgi:hypothetical protein
MFYDAVCVAMLTMCGWTAAVSMRPLVEPTVNQRQANAFPSHPHRSGTVSPNRTVDTSNHRFSRIHREGVAEGGDRYEYGVMFDAGSSATRCYIYKWPQRASGAFAPLTTCITCVRLPRAPRAPLFILRILPHPHLLLLLLLPLSHNGCTDCVHQRNFRGIIAGCGLTLTLPLPTPTPNPNSNSVPSP